MPGIDRMQGLLGLTLVSFALLGTPSGAAAQVEGKYVVGQASAGDGSPSDAIFDARGLSPYRDVGGLLPFEHIDPFTGNLLLTFTDVVLPGNGGFDLKIQRSYNSKIFSDYFYYFFHEDSWAGLGWSMHLGRVLEPVALGQRAIIEMPDGSAHPVYSFLTAQETITRTYWRYSSGQDPTVLRRSDGVVYRFGHVGNVSSSGRPYRYVTRITDPFGNQIDINYQTAAGAPRDAINTITQWLGTPGSAPYRTVQFGYNSDKGNLTSMTVSDSAGGRTRTWYYDQRPLDHAPPASPVTLLWRVRPPAGGPWTFGYQASTVPYYELNYVGTPHGGWVSYTHGPFFHQYCSVVSTTANIPIRTRGVMSRSTGGVDVAGGTWTYSYAQGVRKDKTVIVGPSCAGRTTYTFYGIGGNEGICDYEGGPTPILHGWKIGVQLSRVTADDWSVWQSESYDWQRSVLISEDDEPIGPYTMPAIWIALLRSRTLYRDGATYTTTHDYRTENLNDYGRPWQTTETGELSRVTERGFQYGFAPYIINRLDWERVTTGGETFEKDFSYNPQNGFVTATIPYGIPTTYTPGPFGNVGTVTNANGNAVSHAYAWGVPQSTTTPAYTINRGINPDGTTAWEERRGGVRFSYTYDGLFRLSSVTRPVGNSQTTTHDLVEGGLVYTEERMGPSWTRTFLTGFGRPGSTVNSEGVKKDFAYDACGRLFYDGYPYEGSANLGTFITYDLLGRVRRKTNPDDSFATFNYEFGTDVVITNERGETTRQDWSHFGDPDGAGRLRQVKDADNKTWSYAYNALGSLRQVTPPTGPVRQWTYYGTGETGGTHGLLKQEINPELNGPVTYTYYPAGNVKTRQDPQFGTATYHYDGNNRLKQIDRPGRPSTLIGYNEWDQRTLLQNGSVNSGFGYDNSNRLTARTDNITDAAGTRTFTAVYTPDGNDNVSRIDYPRRATDPPALSVTYTYDSANRPKAAYRTGTGCPGTGCFAHTANYHPSGAIESFIAGNGQTHSMTYDPDRYWIRRVNAGPFLDLDYVRYDDTGNLEFVTDGRGSEFNQNFNYDDLDRLTSATGPWGNGSFSYDDRGNRRTKNLPDCSTTYSYDSSKDRLTGATANGGACAGEADSFGYDANGNLASQNGRTYTYTPENMLETATVGTRTTTYRYDGDNLRKLRDLGGAKMLYVHGLGSQILTEFSEPCAGALERVRDYVYLGTRLLASVRPAAGATSVALTAATMSVNESASIAPAIRVSTGNSQPTICPIAVTYATANGTAIAGADYTTTSGSHTFPPGTANNTVLPVNVPLLNDLLDEDDETFRFDVSSVTGALLGTAPSAIITIVDDDAMPEVFASSVSVTELDLGFESQAVFNLGLSASSGRTVTVNFATADRDATAADYVGVADSRTFAPGATTTIPVPVRILGDNLDEDDEQFSFQLSSPANATVRAGDWRGTIVDNDPLPFISTQDRGLTEGDTGSQALNFPVRLNVPSGRRVWFLFQTEDLTARAGRDYVAQDTPYVIEPGQTVLNVPVTVLGDRVYEPGGESFRVKLAPAPTAVVSPPGPWLGTIADNDPPPTVSVSDCTRVERNGGTSGDSPLCGFVVSLSNPSSLPVSVNYATAQNPPPGTDYLPVSGTLTIEPETSQQTVYVTINGDLEPENNEEFLFNLTGPTNATVADGQGVGTIIDDEKSLFRPVAPCRVLDTRSSSAVQAGESRSFPVSGQCGVPLTAKAVAVNVTAVQQTAAGNLRLFPAGLPVPDTSVLNFAAQTPRANNATVLLGTSGGVTVLADGAQAHVIVDVFGYYVTAP